MIHLEPARVRSTEEIYPGTFVTWYENATLCRGATPGQFVMVQPRPGLDPFWPRAFSFYRFRGEGKERQFALLYAVVGAATRLMAQQPPGDAVWMTGPLGHGLQVRPGATNLLLVGGGVGMAPLVALADQEVARGQSMVICCGARTAATAFPAALLPPEVEYRRLHRGRLAGAARPGDRPLRPVPPLGRSDARLRPCAHVPQHGGGRAAGRYAPLGPDTHGDGDGLRHRHLLRLRRLHQEGRQTLLQRRPPL